MVLAIVLVKMPMNNSNPMSIVSQLPQSIQRRIRHLERMRSDFVANVSHELRTPLTVIRGYLETLLPQANDKAPEWEKIFLQMHQHSLRMENIIEDLLLLSHLESAEESGGKKRVHVAALLSRLGEEAKAVSGEQQHNLSLSVDKSLVLKGNEDELKSLFSNVIINAIKYTPAKGKIDIHWYQQDNHAIFEVNDSGIGIEPKHIPRLTERFYRVDKARSRGSGGTGLGLAIVKHVLTRHHGELFIESKPEQGSQFRCQFSLDP